MDKVRVEIGRRLGLEISRRAMKTDSVAKCSGVDAAVIDSYLVGSRKLDFRELSSVCDSLGINSVRLIYSPKYLPPKIAFRAIGPKEQRVAAEIEDAFLLIKDFLPKISLTRLSRQNTTLRNEAILEAAIMATKVKNQYQTPEQFLSENSIPVIPIRSNECFDAFLLSDSAHAAICVNSNRPPLRIRYSLAHEISHLIFDKGVELNVDVMPPDLYFSSISKEIFPEVFAYKFAEFFLLPVADVFDMAKAWPNINLGKAQELLDIHGTTREVLSNAIYDGMRALELINPGITTTFAGEYRSTSDVFNRMDFESADYGGKRSHSATITLKMVRESLSKLRQGNLTDDQHAFLTHKKRDLAAICESARDQFSDTIFDHIAGVFQF